MTPDEIRDRITAAIQPALDRADQIINECRKGPGRHYRTALAGGDRHE